MITDVHTHSTFSHDGESDLAAMLARARSLNVAYYGVAEHFDYDCLADRILAEGKPVPMIDAAAYFAAGRALQRAYEGEMHVLIGGEFGWSDNPQAHALTRETMEQFRPDFVVNSVHTVNGHDAWFPEYFAGKSRERAFGDYLAAVRRSLDAPYDYDIVAHIGYVARNAPYAERGMPYAPFAPLFDDILSTIVAKGKILEINGSARGAGDFLPDVSVIRRYLELGGSKFSYASDAHAAASILRGREKAIEALRYLGVTHLTVPERGKHHLVPIA